MGEPTTRDGVGDSSTPSLGDADPASPSARQAVPPLAPPLDRGVQPVVAVGFLAALLVMLWLRKKFLARKR